METFLIYTAKVALAISVFYIFYLLLFRQRKQFRFNRIYLSGSLCLSFIIPLITITIERPPVRQLVFLPESGVVTHPFVINSPSGFDFSDLLLVVYIGVTVLFFLHLLTGYIKTFSIIRECRLTVVYGTRIYVAHEDIHPFTFLGKIVVADNTLAHPGLEMILNHEKIHAREKHTLDILLSEIFFPFQWFNPFAWLQKEAIKNNLEFLTDQQVIYHSDMKAYQLAMFSLAGKRGVATFLNALNGNDLKNRIIMMKKKTENKNKVIRQLTILPLLVILILGLSNKEFKAAPIPVSGLPGIVNFYNQQNGDQNVAVNDTQVVRKKQVKIIGNGTNETFNGESVIINMDGDTTGVRTIMILDDSKSKNPGKKSTGQKESKEIKVIVKTTRQGGDSSKVVVITDKNGKEPLYIMDDKEIKSIEGVSPDQIESISVLKDESAIKTYGEKGKNGVVIITSKKSGQPENNVLIILDGKEATKKVADINPDEIQSVNVWKGESATAKYGEKGKNGVIEITTKHSAGNNNLSINTTRDLRKEIASSIQYPVKAQEAGQQGTVKVYAFVNEEGKITQITELKPEEDFITVDEVVTVGYAAQKDRHSSGNYFSALSQEASLRIKNLPDLNIPEFKNKWVAFQFKFVLQ